MSDTEEIAHALAGAGGGALSMIVTYPLVTLSTLAQTKAKKKEEIESKLTKEQQHKLEIENSKLTFNEKLIKKFQNNSSYIAAKEIIKEKGIFGLYSGLESAIYGITLTNFIYYYFYELTSNIFLKANKVGNKRKTGGLSTFQSIITGAIAGAITCIGSNPFWVANTRMMTEKKSQQQNLKEGEKPKSNSTFKTIVEIIEQDGFTTLFAGVLPALVLVINPIIQYTIFEQIKNIIILNGGQKSFTAIKAFFIGAFGKLIATSLTYPYITLKSRMHIRKKNLQKIEEEKEGKPINKEKNLSMIQEIKKIINEEGIEGLYGGLIVKLIQSISTAAFLFYFKEELLVGSIKLVEIFKLLSFKKNNNKVISNFSN
ncbi:uncharacterized protein KGF55_001391 [Candida pseudojiufengensis]|uniref:uncharacterized protein n=1 Tax=Candida pseudojiufengensis TaxID=497109 RepID=UPI002223EE74|nr:uncharacterized protein KGF55_001391 [Candida pseudojiufengensis]KAI5965171.1 hypothetical protein KGF55_001391 [Candida pseudojiufengensis]